MCVFLQKMIVKMNAHGDLDAESNEQYGHSFSGLVDEFFLPPYSKGEHQGSDDADAPAV